MSDQQEAKDKFRNEARLALASEVSRGEQSAIVIDRLMQLPRYQAAKCVLWYVDFRDEVQTQSAIKRELGGDREVIVPYCQGAELELFRLHDFDHLATGTYGILEPSLHLRGLSEHIVDPGTVDFVVVPGVAFDRSGGRIGYGKGYYDRLLSRLPSSTFKAAIALDCQVFESVPTSSHDIAMDIVVTPSRSYP